MRSFIMITATIVAIMATCVLSVPVSSDDHKHEENVMKVGTEEEEKERTRKACDEIFVAIKEEPSIVTMQKFFDKVEPKVVSEKYEQLFRNLIYYCKETFGSTEPAPEEKHLESIKASLVN
uniref:Uncharacterized protein n=1 Tax=Romanomermis culicivorax TaxID=13658 RepID=A0A915KAR6_ROMCU